MIIEGRIHVLDRASAGALRGTVRLEDVSEADAPSKEIVAAPVKLDDDVTHAPFRLALGRAAPADAHPILRDPFHRPPAADAERAGDGAVEPLSRRIGGKHALLHRLLFRGARVDRMVGRVLVDHALATSARTCSAAQEETA